jgi:hypothetical protein
MVVLGLGVRFVEEIGVCADDNIVMMIEILDIRASLTFCPQAFVPSDDALGIWGVTGDVW